jgi:hypothetical protein
MKPGIGKWQSNENFLAEHAEWKVYKHPEYKKGSVPFTETLPAVMLPDLLRTGADHVVIGTGFLQCLSSEGVIQTHVLP